MTSDNDHPVSDNTALPEALNTPRGAKDRDTAKAWLEVRGIEEIECLVPDMAGVARGKIMPTKKFFTTGGMSLPQSVFFNPIAGSFPNDDLLPGFDTADSDLQLEPDYDTLTSVPWATDPTGQVIHDAYHRDGRPMDMAPRQILKRVIEMYAVKGWEPVVAPELEFYLVKQNVDPDYPLEPPTGRSGRAEFGRQPFSISAVNEFDPLFEDIYDYSEKQGLEIDTLSHEEGAAQMEINLRHGHPLALADQVFHFKRTIREAALQHDIHATFMAKPIEGEPGSAMHIHQSVIDRKTGKTIFSDDESKPTPVFFAFIAGQQTYLPAVTCMLAPYVNSYRRLTRDFTHPVNALWGYDNRTTGLRVPPSSPEARRVENRVPSSDANPYLAIAACLACGYLGMVENLSPSPAYEGNAQREAAALPRGLLDAVAAFEECEPLKALFGPNFPSCYRTIKEAEYETFMRVISPWEREHLLLNV